MRRILVGAVCLMVLVSCSSSNECQDTAKTPVTCETTNDCVQGGLSSLNCINGACTRGCADDADCAGFVQAALQAEMACVLSPLVCESQACVQACPDAPCGDGETCAAGRCVLFAEDFEPEVGATLVVLEEIGWNAIDYGPKNELLRVVASGIPGCVGGDDFCAGPAANGERFVVLGRSSNTAVTEAGQAVVSPEIDLGSRGGVRVELSYVAFDVGYTYARPTANMPSSTWPVLAQSVRVEGCRDACGADANWVRLRLASDADAELPLDRSERRNGLGLGNQSGLDWRFGRVSVVVPDDLLAPSFRFRLLPNLESGALVGLDDVRVRRLQ